MWCRMVKCGRFVLKVPNVLGLFIIPKVLLLKLLSLLRNVTT